MLQLNFILLYHVLTYELGAIFILNIIIEMYEKENIKIIKAEN